MKTARAMKTALPQSQSQSQSRAGGFVLPSAIFLLVILALLAAFMVVFAQMQNVTSVQDVQGARAYQAARAGIQWGLYRVLDPLNTTVVAPGEATWPNMPPCASGNLTIEGFPVQVSCESWAYAENGGNHQIQVYRLTATAQSGTVGAMGFIEREVEVTVVKCRAVDGAAPGYECS
jgi:MSHA biogenesis protein MshP